MADDAKPGDDDRRGDSRAPIELKVEYKRLNSFFADYTKNISRGGSFIGTEKPLPVGTEFVFALGWLVVVLSIGAISLLTLLIRRGAATKVASLFYLVPPVTASIAFFLFGETLGPLALAGFVLAVVGVAVVVRN